MIIEIIVGEDGPGFFTRMVVYTLAILAITYFGGCWH